MTRTYCDVCGAEVNVDSLPKPTHFRLSLSHYEPMIPWDKDTIHWGVLCLDCSASVTGTLNEWAKSRQAVAR